jgi:hypothetical protein
VQAVEAPAVVGRDAERGPLPVDPTGDERGLLVVVEAGGVELAVDVDGPGGGVAGEGEVAEGGGEAVVGRGPAGPVGRDRERVDDVDGSGPTR